MTTLHEQLFAESSLEVLFEQHGQAVTYTPYSGTGVSLTAVLGAERIETLVENDRRFKRRKRTCTISTDPTSAYGGVAAPGLKGTVTVGTVVYAIAEISPFSASFANLVLLRPEPMDKSRDIRGHR